ncbi:hypothetical protein EYF80_011392 [Liparis tanakae]|uniref:Uncharacterized protein n=1 Tax=Liparis tanakae TaxID=230148 RepID=A0A4Z2IKY4_9TELE|nr:hypothetical protein EYF80_011392 [Liparis tanakae]
MQQQHKGQTSGQATTPSAKLPVHCCATTSPLSSTQSVTEPSAEPTASKRCHDFVIACLRQKPTEHKKRDGSECESLCAD